MKKSYVFNNLVLVVIIFATILSSCKKDDDPIPLSLTSLEADGIDLNGASSPENVPVNPTIIAVFATEVDATTATTANIKLERKFDMTDIDIAITTSGKTITITPNSELYGGALYELSFSDGLKSQQGLSLTSLTRSFKTIGTFVPSGQIAHWNFESDANDQVGSYNPTANGVVDISYVSSRNTDAGMSASFNGSTSIIEIPNGDALINTTDFTLAFWVKTNSTKGTGMFVMGLGAFYGFQFEIFGGYDGAKFATRFELADGTTAAEDMWFPADATYADNGGWQGWDFAKSISADDMAAMLKDTWLHVVYTYDATAKKATLYFNGEIMKSFDFNLWPDGDAKQGVTGIKWDGDGIEVVNEFAFGFIQSRAGTLWDNEPWGGYGFPDANHFKGELDDIRFFHSTLSAQEIDLMYSSEK